MERRNRRQFMGTGLALAGLAILTGRDSLPAAAAPAPSRPRVGFVHGDGDDDKHFRIRKSLADLGHRDRDNLMFERFGSVGLPQQAVAEMLRQRVDVILAPGASAAQAARTATSTVPIVMLGVSDPVALGLVASLSHPGGNVTGLSKRSSNLARKRLELLLEMLPGATQVSVVWNPTDADARLELSETAVAAAQLGLLLKPLPVHTPADYAAAFDAAAADPTQPVLVLSDPITRANTTHVQIALDKRLGTMYDLRRFVLEQGLFSYGPSVSEEARQVAYLIDRILKGTRPADLPVLQPTEFDLVVNLKTARQLGLTIPPSIQALRPEVI